MTKKELIQVRESTYKPPTRPPKRCETCRFFYWNYGNTGASFGKCHVVESRGQLVQKEVHIMGVCALWAEFVLKGSKP